MSRETVAVCKEENMNGGQKQLETPLLTCNYKQQPLKKGNLTTYETLTYLPNDWTTPEHLHWHEILNNNHLNSAILPLTNS